ncbi:unnamed protein product [Rotaria sp. Silwood1]|nr:unnamed protein product [Rotaria sp. Silwood1]CAF4848738.1 unnamed protein product [Rotaria sp. Silwood1]
MATSTLSNDDFHRNSADQHLEIFGLIWLDADVNIKEIRNTEQQFRSIINHLKKFQDVKQCQQYIEERSQKDRLVLIVSGRLGREIVPSIHKLRQVISIYVYCMDKKSNEQWSCEFAKVKAVVVELDELVSRIKTDHKIQKKVEEPLSISVLNTSIDTGKSTIGVNGEFVFSQVLIDCLLRLKSTQTDINELINYLKNEYEGPLRAPAIDIHPNATWRPDGITVAGGNGKGNELNQLDNPHGLYVDDDQTIYIADYLNHRIVAWKYGATSGQVVAGGNGQGNGTNQLDRPHDVIVDKERDSLIISDAGNYRVVRWPRRNGASGETIISHIDCMGLTLDQTGSLYVSDFAEGKVLRYRIGDFGGTMVAGSVGIGHCIDQLYNPCYVFVDQDRSVYVSDSGNYRVMKWEEGAKEGIVVESGPEQINDFSKMHDRTGVVVDQLNTVYVADYYNHRIIRWPKGATQGSIIAGGNGRGKGSNQLFFPQGLSFDRYGNLYVADQGNFRVQKFNIKQMTN